MGSIHDYYWNRLQKRLNEMAHELAKGPFASFRVKDTWTPAVNAYRCRDAILLCVDLAGVEPEHVTLRVEPRRVQVRGARPTVRPDDAFGPPSRILALEIEDGPFEREILLPEDIDPERVRVECRGGFLWIQLSMRVAF